jgi:Na+(H+)/acetate symporter ActP
MGAAEIAEFSGYLFAAYASGWGSGYLIYAFRRLVDFV